MVTVASIRSFDILAVKQEQVEQGMKEVTMRGLGNLSTFGSGAYPSTSEAGVTSAGISMTEDEATMREVESWFAEGADVDSW